MGTIKEFRPRPHDAHKFRPSSVFRNILRHAGVLDKPALSDIDAYRHEENIHMLKDRFHEILSHLPDSAFNRLFTIKKPSLDELGKNWLHLIELPDILEGHLDETINGVRFVAGDGKDTVIGFELSDADQLTFEAYYPEDALRLKEPQNALEREESRMQLAVSLLANARIAQPMSAV